MARCGYDHILVNNRHDSTKYPSTIDDTIYLSNHAHNPNIVSYARHNIKQTPYDRVRSWITSRRFTQWSYCVFRVAITEI